MIGHVPPLLRNFEKLFLDVGISLLGEFFALARLAVHGNRWRGKVTADQNAMA